VGEETPLTEVEAASTRLSMAIDRLESVLAAAPGPGVASERDSLRDELATLRARYDELAKITETVSAGLDSSISHIKAVLGG
jgi:hypothetical protein